MDWFLYENGPLHERVKLAVHYDVLDVLGLSYIRSIYAMGLTAPTQKRIPHISFILVP